MLHLPLLLGYRLSDRQAIIDADVRRWSEVLRRDLKLLDLLPRPEFRSLYYHRIKTGNRASRIANGLVAWAFALPNSVRTHCATPEGATSS